MKQDGFSLVELVTVISIIAILLAISTISFNAWQLKANVEKQTREMAADFKDLRLRAMNSKQRHIMTLMPNKYTFRRYSSEAESAAAGTVVFQKDLKYPITNIDGSSLAGTTVDVDIRGFTNDSPTIWVSSKAEDAAFDCVTISAAQARIGKKKGISCEPK